MTPERIAKRNDETIKTLEPDMQALCRAHVEACAAEGITLLIYQGRRTYVQQGEKWAKGRTKPGPIVTNARPGYSWHNFGKAYDAAVIEDGNIDWNSPKYARAGRIGKALGLIWGGDFKSVKGDLGHFEYHPNTTLAAERAKVKLA